MDIPERSSTLLRSIRRSLYIGAIITCILLSLVIGYYTYQQDSNEAERDLAYVLAVKESAIGAHVDLLVSTARTISARPGPISSLEALEAGAIGLMTASQEITSDLQTAMSEQKRVYGIMQTDRQGRVVAMAGTVPSALNPPPESQKAISFRGPLVISGNAYLVIDVLLVAQSGSVVGYNSFLFGTSFLDNVLGSTEGDTVPRSPFVGAHTETGAIVVFPSKDVGAIVQPSTHIGTVISAPGTVAKPQLSAGASDENDTVIAAMDVGETPLRLALSVDKGDLYGPAREAAYENVALISGTMLVLVLLFSAILWPLSNRLPLRSDDLERLVAAKTAALQSELDMREETERRLEQQRAELSAFAHTVAHHLKNNIMVIENLLALEGRTEIGDRLLATTAKMKEFITRQLRLADAGKAVSGIERCDINAMLDRLAAGFRLKIIHDELPKIPCDRGRMEEVFQNLAGNAANHGHATELHVSYGSGQGMHVITVTDNGTGIPEELLPRVFDMGVSTSGGGFGLAIVKKIVEAHRGSIVAEHAERGARFVIRLPESTTLPGGS